MTRRSVGFGVPLSVAPALALALALGLATVVPVPVARAQASGEPRREKHHEAAAPEVSEREVVERLLELQAEIERLLPHLSPELRRAIAERLAQRAAELADEARKAEAPAGPATPPEKEMPSAAASEPPGTAAAPETPSSEVPSTETRATETPAPHDARTACNTLTSFDTTHDGRVDAGDRYWRYLYLWTDRNGDGVVEEHEVRSLFDLGVRAISVRLDRFEGEKGVAGRVRVDRWIVLDPRGDGFSGGVSGDTDDGALTVDADRLGRFTGPRLLDAEGRPLTGYQPFRAGLRLRVASGQVIELSCPG